MRREGQGMGRRSTSRMSLSEPSTRNNGEHSEAMYTSTNNENIHSEAEQSNTGATITYENDTSDDDAAAPMAASALLATLQMLDANVTAMGGSLEQQVDALLMQQLRSPVCDSDVKFLHWAMHSLFRFKHVLRVSTDVLYHYNLGSLQREDARLYMLFFLLAYIGLGLKQLTFNKFVSLMKSQDTQKVTLFLRFAFDNAYVQGPIQNEWLLHMDRTWVDATVSNILSFADECIHLAERLEEKEQISIRKRRESSVPYHKREREIITTQPEPFGLSEPKYKLVPPPDDELFSAPPQPKPLPQFSNSPPKERLQLERKQKENRENAVQPEPFELKTSSLPVRQQDLRMREELKGKEQEEEEQQNKTLRHRPAPPAPKAEVKLNATAVLREDAVYKRKQEEEAKMLREYEQTLKDEHAFQRKQEELAKQEEEERKQELERRKKAMEAVHQQAAEARRKKQHENHQEAAKIRELTKGLEEKRCEDNAADEAAKKTRKAMLEEEKQNAKAAKERVASEKRSLAEERAHERAEASKQREEEKRLEQERKEDLVRQIKAIERVPTKHEPDVDPSATAGHGLLEEMSITELRERLQMAKDARNAAEEERRQKIVQAKQEQSDWLQSKVENIQRVRAVAKASTEKRRAEREREKQKAQEEERLKRQRDAEAMNKCLQEKKQAQRQERERLLQERKEVQRKQQQQQQSAADVERRRFDSVKRGAEREALARQKSALRRAHKEASARAADKAQRQMNAQRESERKARFLRQFDQKLAAASSEKTSPSPTGTILEQQPGRQPSIATPRASQVVTERAHFREAISAEPEYTLATSDVGETTQHAAEQDNHQHEPVPS